MSYDIFTSENGNYIVCRVNGAITVDIAREFTKKLSDLTRSTNIKRVLSDVRNARNELGTLENYYYAYKDMGEFNIQRNSRSAILVDPVDKSHDFVETVAQNAGYNVKVFQDETAAIAWLQEEESG